MNLDNSKRASRIRLIYMLIPLLVVIAVGSIFLFTDVKDFKYVLYAFVFLVVYFIMMAIPGFYFVSFYAGPDKIQVRYKSLAPFLSNNNSIQIKSPNFRKYEIKSSFGGFKKSLFLYQETPGGLARFPKVSLTTLSSDEISAVIKALDLLLAINKAAK